MTDLAERLRRIRRPSAGDASPTAPLDRLETDLLGGTADGLSLKERLERLVAAASRGRSGLRSVALEDLVEGRRVANDHGEFFQVESASHLETYHGEMPLSRLLALLPDSVGILSGEPQLQSFDLSRAVFLDTETTGLSGGSGTAAFLIGVGFVDRDRFVVRQYFMRDYNEEAAQLHQLACDLAGFTSLVTFNGKMFDVPLLEARYRLNRTRFPLADALHLDLLHPARRLWKARLESCRLQSLEAKLLGVRREGDVAGEEIPRLYFEYVRSRDARALPRILEHNRVDIVSLAALAVLACQWVEEGRAEDPRDVFSLGRVLERAELYERSEAAYRRAVAEDSPVRVPSLLRLAARAKRTGDHAMALELWSEAAAAGDCLALRELAVHHEHRTRDLSAALEASERALGLLASCRDAGALRQAAEFERRRQRVVRKLAR
jgi:hypothetical protein